MTVVDPPKGTAANKGETSAAPDATEITRQAVKGSAWNMAASLGARILGLIGTVVLIRFVAPGDYGEAAAATLVAFSANQVSTLGVGIYLIAHPRAPRNVVFAGTLMHLSLGAVAFALALVLGHRLSSFLDAPKLHAYLPWMLIAAGLDRIGFVPERLIQTRLQFGRLSILRSAGELVYTGTSVWLAVAGYGAMAIAWGNLARSAVRSGFMLALVHPRDWLYPTKVKAQTIKDVARFGSVVYLGSLAATAIRRWDGFLISRFFGPAVLGTYNLAYNLADVPAAHVGEPIIDVVQPSLAHLRDADRKAMLLRTVRILALLLAPLSVGLGLTAPTLTRTFLETQWRDVGPMLMILAVMSVPRPINAAASEYLQVRLRPFFAMLLDLLTLAFMMLLLFTVGRMSPLAACGAVGASFAFRLYVTALALRRTDQILVRTFLAQLVPPLLACIPMAAAVIGVREIMPDPWPARLRLVIEIVVGVPTYFVAALAIARRGSRELRDLVLLGFSKKGLIAAEPAAAPSSLPAEEGAKPASWRWEVAEANPLSQSVVSAWQSLATRVGLAETAGPVWMRCFGRTFFRMSRTTHFLYRNSELVAALPLVHTGVVPAAWLSMENEHSPYFDFPVDWSHAGVGRKILEHVLHSADYLFLRRLHLDGPTCKGLVAAAEEMNRRLSVLQNSGDAFIALEGPWDTFLKNGPSGLTKDLKRYFKPDKLPPGLTCERISPGPELSALLEECFGLEMRTWKGQEGTAIVLDPQTHRFYNELALEASQRGTLSLYVLRLGDKIIAYDLGLRAAGQVDSLKISYDPDYSDLQPGNLLTFFSLKHEINEGVALRFHLGRPSVQKRRWASAVHPVGSLRVFGNTPASKLAYYGGPVLRGQIKQALRRKKDPRPPEDA